MSQERLFSIHTKMEMLNAYVCSPHDGMFIISQLSSQLSNCERIYSFLFVYFIYLL